MGMEVIEREAYTLWKKNKKNKRRSVKKYKHIVIFYVVGKRVEKGGVYVGSGLFWLVQNYIHLLSSLMKA